MQELTRDLIPALDTNLGVDPRHRTACQALDLLFPTLRGRSAGPMNMEAVFSAEMLRDPSFSISDPLRANLLLTRWQELQGLDYSYGGWLEDREQMFKGTYIEKLKRFIHLGVDINVPAGTPVSFPPIAQVLGISRSLDRDIGWGTRIDLAHNTLPLVFLLGHLMPDLTVKPGDILTEDDQIIARIGDPEVNGYVTPHLHIQVMDRTRYQALLGKDLDGYGTRAQANELAWAYPDPLITLAELMRNPT